MGFFDRRNLLETLGKAGQPGVGIVIELLATNGFSESEMSDFTDNATEQSVDHLIMQTQSEQPTHRRVAILLLGRVTSGKRFEARRAKLERDFIPWLDVPDVDVQQTALRIVTGSEDQNLKLQAAPRIGKLLGAEDSNLRYRAASFLASAGEIAMPMIDAALNSENPLEKVGGCLSLQQIKPSPVSRLATILALLDDESDLVRSTAITTLGYFQPTSEQVLTTLVTSLDEVKLRYSALSALGRLGESATATLDDLYPLLHSDDVSLRIAAARAVWKINADVPRVLPVLCAIVRDDEGLTTSESGTAETLVEAKRVNNGSKYTLSESGQAASVLGEMGPAAVPAVEALLQRIDTKDVRLQRSLLTALSRIGPEASAAVPALLQLAEEREDSRSWIRLALEKIDPAAAEKLKSMPRLSK